MHHWATVKQFLRVRARSREHVGENAGLRGKEPTVDAESDAPRDKDQVAILKPELVVMFEVT